MKTVDMTRIYGNKTYKGKWVAIKDFETKPKVVAYGKILKETLGKAEKKDLNIQL